jgi:excisionase family DNA binding protein
MTSHIEPATYDSKEAAARLDVHIETLRAAVREGRWPHIRMNRHIKFTEDQIQQILKMYEVAPTPPKTPRNRKAA